MTMIFGVGIENEMTFAFTDKYRIKRNMVVQRSTSSEISPGRSGQRWTPTGWHENQASGIIYSSRDPTVDGNAAGSGFEFQTTSSYALGKKPKDLINYLFQSLNDASRVFKSQPAYPYSIPNPFGASPGFSYKRYGSYHLNLTMPYDKEKIESDERYREAWQKKLFKGCKVIRTIEPLIIAMIGGADADTVGNPSYAEGSSRQAYDSYANLGSVKLDGNFYEALINPHASDMERPFKGGNIAPPFRGILKHTVASDAVNVSGESHRVSDATHGDFVPKHYRNVSHHASTVELRFLDPFFVPNLYEVMKVVIAAFEHGANVPDIIDARTAKAWNDATAAIIEEGWNARMPLAYQRMIKEKLGLDIKTKNDMRADILFGQVEEKLWEKNKNGIWVKTMFDEFSPPHVLNLNRYNWDIQFRHKYVNDAAFTTYIDKILASLGKINASASNGWIQVTDAEGKITVRDLIFDDPHFGPSMGPEDFEDIIFLLERIKAVKLKTNSSGQIIALKVLFTDPKTTMKAIDNLKTIDGVEETYFGQETAPAPERRVTPTPTPSPEPQARPQLGTRIQLTSDNATVDLSTYHLTRITPARESPLEYNVEDMKEILRRASFLAEDGQPFTYAVIPVMTNDAFSVLWTRHGHRIDIYLKSNTWNNPDMTISELIDTELRHHFASPTTAATFVPSITFNDFVSRLLTIARQHYSKAREEERIELDNAGLQTLNEYGLRIASKERGKQYFIVNKKRYSMLKKKIPHLNLINYIPYQKSIYVQKQGNTFTLIMGDRPIDKIRREA